jgi:hypothetical protein
VWVSNNTCVKMGNGKKGQDGKTKNKCSQSFHVGLWPTVSHDYELVINDRS